MDTKSKNSKYNPFIKFIAIFLTVVFAFLAGINCLNLIRKSIFFANENYDFTSTPAFNEEMDTTLWRLKYLKEQVNIYKANMTFEDFQNSQAAKETIDYWKAKEERAIKLFDTIQELKKLEPDYSEEANYVLYYNPENDLYYDENTDTWITYEEFTRDYNEDTVTVYDWDSVEYEDENGIFTTVYSIGSIPSDEELFKLEESYSSYKKWDKKYQQLRYAIFNIVNDATSHETIKADIESSCTEQLYSSYEDLIIHTENTIKKFVNVSFIIKDNKTGNIISNIKDISGQTELLNNLRSNALYFIDFNGKKLNSPVPKEYRSSNIIKFLNETSVLDCTLFDEQYFSENFEGYSVYLKLTSDLKQGDDYYNTFKAFESVQKTPSQTYLYTTLICIILSVAALCTAGFLSGKQKDGTIKLAPTDKTPFIIYSATTVTLLFGLGFIMIYIVATDLSIANVIDEQFIWLVTSDVLLAGIGVATALFSLILTNFILYIERNVKAKTLTNRFLIGYTLKKLSAIKSNRDELSLSVKQLKQKTIIALAGYVIINLILLIFCFTDFAVISVAAMVIFNTLVMVYAIRYLSDVSRLSNIAEQIRNGTLDTIIRPGSYVSPLRKFAVDLSACRDSIEGAISNAIKGEHLKTELITNVSHDLKTPLTSIINYVSLLKMCNMQGDDANKYLDILDDKSRKLQRLIEDLTEASKATSGNIKMNIDTVNLNELALQAVGENNDVLENAGLDLILTQKDNEIFVKADSQHTFRIIDNLFSNAKKYSLTGTRVYVDVYKENGYGVLSIKNISRDKLNITPDELTERFVRGDNSRTTDGSGLGLSIARSFAELQNGLFVIEIDGDMFRASLKLPLTTPPKKQKVPQPQAAVAKEPESN